MRRGLKPALLRILVAIFVAGLVVAFHSTAQAAAGINSQVSFQGKLVNTNGTNLADGTYNLQFKIYQDGTNAGVGSTLKWTESRLVSGSNGVTVTNGIFQVNLGSITPFGGSIDWNQDTLWLSINVGGTASSPTWDGEMTPFIRLTSVPYALNAGSISGLTASQLVQLSPSSAQTGDINIAGNVASTGLNVNTGSSASASINSGTSAPTTDQFVVDNTGSSGVTTAGVNGASIKYKGGAAAVEASGLRIDYQPGSTSGGTWSGIRVVADSTGPASGVTSYGIKLEGPTSAGAGDDTAAYIGTGWDIGLDVQSGGVQLAGISSEPNAPAANNLKIYSKDVAGRMLLKMKGPSGLDTPLQPALFFNSIGMITPQTGTTITQWGMPNTTVGTASTPTPTSTNMHTSMKRITVTSAATANSASELRSAQMMVWRGNQARLGGFFFTCRFGVNSTTASQRLFVGLLSSTAAISTSQNISSLTNMVGVGWDSADTTLQIMTNDGTSTATKINAGSLFPANNTTAMYEFVLFAAPNGSSIGYRLQRLDTGDITSGSLTTDLPVNTNFLAPHEYMNNGGTAAAVVLDVNRVYIESDY